MGVKKAETALLDRALRYASNLDDKCKSLLTLAALRYAKEKKNAANKRDKWKEKKRLNNEIM